MKITFRDFYDNLKEVVNKNNFGAKTSKISNEDDRQLVMEYLTASVENSIKNLSVELPSHNRTSGKAKTSFVELIDDLCQNDNTLTTFKEKGWLDISDQSNNTKSFGEIGNGYYVFKDANPELLMVRAVKAVLEILGEEKLQDYVFHYDIKQSFNNFWWLNSVKENQADWKKDGLLKYTNIGKEKLETLQKGDTCIVYESSSGGGKRALIGLTNVNEINGNEVTMGELIEFPNPLQFLDIPKELIALLSGAGKPLEANGDKAKMKGTIFKLTKEEFERLVALANNKQDKIVLANLTNKEIIDKISKFIFYKGFIYDDDLIENLYLCLKSKPFVILAGTSGTGKTRLVKLFAEAIGANSENERFKLVPVRPDWSDSSDLFGHVDLDGNFVPGTIIDFIKEASKVENADLPYFLCLDEMNLARVEYYLSDFLAVIETRDFKDSKIVTDLLVNKNVFGSKQGEYEQMQLPSNLYVIGTVNMDETTFPFSKKVLDRANTIEFNYVNLATDFANSYDEKEKVKPVGNVSNKFLLAEFVKLQECVEQMPEEKEFIDDIAKELNELNKVLFSANAHIGYRVRDEIIFYMLYNKRENLLNADKALDNAVLQKILPRINGSSTAVNNLLIKLMKRWLSTIDDRKIQELDNMSSEEYFEEIENLTRLDSCQFKKSTQKVAFMYRRMKEDGFTSYWL